MISPSAMLPAEVVCIVNKEWERSLLDIHINPIHSVPEGFLLLKMNRTIGQFRGYFTEMRHEIDKEIQDEREGKG